MKKQVDVYINYHWKPGRTKGLAPILQFPVKKKPTFRHIIIRAILAVFRVA